MAEAKTRPTDQDVANYIEGVADERRRREGRIMLELMREVTGEEPVMWGPSIVGFGRYHYRYASGREGDSPLTGFSPRKQSLTVYIMPGFARYAELLGRLGKHTTGASCLYIKRLDEIDLPTLRELVGLAVAEMKRSYPAGGDK